jgi:hypothetical protein
MPSNGLFGRLHPGIAVGWAVFFLPDGLGLSRPHSIMGDASKLVRRFGIRLANHWEYVAPMELIFDWILFIYRDFAPAGVEDHRRC